MPPSTCSQVRSLRHAWVPVLAGLACLWLVPLRATADIYERVDANGVVHYTNVPPKGRGWKKVLKTQASKARARATGTPRAASDTRRQQGGSNAERLARYEPWIAEAARLYQLPAHFIRAVMRVESNFFSDVVSVKGAMGLMQLMPHTASNMGVRDPFDPRENILGGARYLRILANQFQGDMVLTLAAYNAGHGAVQRYKGVPPYPETRRYVQRVMGHYNAYRDGQRPD